MSYLNPVYPHSFPDPFVMKHQGGYWGYCTGFWQDGRCFGVLHSTDLVHWQALPAAMDPLPGEANCYWAPEVVYREGSFYLYYSVGDGVEMHIRVAVAEHPAGPFIDSGREITGEPFAIDPHAFQDTDGAWYLFYAADFYDHPRVGTGTVQDRLIDPFSLAGQPRPVTRAAYDWQIYDPQRLEKGGVCWHTLEGPFVLEHKGRYYQMFSGGNWQNESYGVSFGVSAAIDPGGEWEQVCDGRETLPVLKSMPELGVVGPGHNSVVRGPDNRQLYCVYHRWMPAVESTPGSGGAKEPDQERVLAIDRLEIIGGRLVVLGPSATTQPDPIPTAALMAVTAAAGWEYSGGDWVWQAGRLLQTAQDGSGRYEASTRLPAGCFVCEVGLERAAQIDSPAGQYGVAITEKGQPLFSAALPATLSGGKRPAGEITYQSQGCTREGHLPLPAGFRPGDYHLLQLEINGLAAALKVDGLPVWDGTVDGIPDEIAFFTRGLPAAFSNLEITAGWEDLFDRPAAGLDVLGWGPAEAAVPWEIVDKQLQTAGLSRKVSRIRKAVTPLDSYELVVNTRLDEITGRQGYGFYPALAKMDAWDGQLCLERGAKEWVLAWRYRGEQARLLLPEGFDPFRYQQFRLLKLEDQLYVRLVGPWGTSAVGAVHVPSGRCQVGLYVHPGARAAFEMVRATAIP